MEMDDELENFIMDQRAKMAEDKAHLKQDPPYMEMRAKDEKADDPAKENIPPFKRSTAQGKEENQCPSLPLGEDYERKKQKLQQELRLDYRRYMAKKKHFDAGEPGPPLAHGERRTVKERRFPHHPSLLPHGPLSPRPPSMRDAATLTEGRRAGGHRGHRPGEGRGPWGDEDRPAPGESRTTWRGGAGAGPEDGDSEEGDCTEEELELMERRRLRLTGLEEAGHQEKRLPRRCYRADGRDRRTEPRGDYIDTSHHGERLSYENRLQGTAGTWVGRRSRLTNTTHKAGFATGLMIGAEDAGEELQRRKELYRQELQEQIAEQQRNRRREKDLEMSVAATGANDPEKRPDRIKQFGLIGAGHRRTSQCHAHPTRAPLGGENAIGRPGDHNPPLGRESERPPPDQPAVAFQSPLLEYSSALGLGGGGGGVTPYGHARGADTPRGPPFAPHPPPSLADAYRIPCYYGPTLPYLGQVALMGGVPAVMGGVPAVMGGVPAVMGGVSAVMGGVHPPMSYPVVPLTGGGGRPTQLGPPSPVSGYSSHAEPPPPPPPAPTHLRPNSNAADVISGISVFPAEKGRSSKNTYKEALDQQIQERAQRRRQEREESDRYEAKLEADMKTHEPWGRGGGGAPLRDSRGNLITDLKQMHKLNEEAYINPETWRRRAVANMAALREERPPSNTRVSGFTHVQTSQVARGNVFPNPPTAQELLEKDKYKTYLRQQIEEKRLKEAEERENARQEEEREERKLEEQRAQILREYKEEQDARRRKETELKAKNEELNRLAEQRRKEEERKKKEAEEKQNSALRRRYERERQTRLEEEPREASPPIPTLQRRGPAPQDTPTLQRRGPAPPDTPRPPTEDSRRSTAPMSERREASPPIPTLQRRGPAPQDTPRPPTVDSRRSTAPMSECSISGLQSPPVPARRNQLRAAEDQRGVISELALLWQKLRSEQRRVEGERLNAEWEEPDSRMTDRRREGVDVFDLARLCLPAPVRRASGRTTEPPNLLHIHHNLQLPYTDSESRYGYREEGQSVDIQTQADLREQRRTNRLRRPDHDYFDLSPPRQPDQYERRAAGDPHTGSLLESESAFIDPLGDAYPVPPTPEHRTPQLSARERRRLAKRIEPHNMGDW